MPVGELLFKILDVCLLALAAITAIAVIQVRSLFAAAMLSGFYSLIMALIWQNMDAMDVSLTEAAVGAGISTILLLGAVVIVGRDEKPGPMINWPALLVVGVTGAALIYGTEDMKRFGDPEAKIHHLRVPEYLTQRVGKAYPLTPDEEPLWPGEDSRWGPQPTTPPRVHAGQEHSHAEHGHIDHGHKDASVAHDAHPKIKDDWKGHVPNTVTSVLASYRGYDTMFETAVIFTAGMGLVLLLRRRRDEDLLSPADADAAESGTGDSETAETESSEERSS